MSEALGKLPDAPLAEVAYRDPVLDLMPPVRAAEINDNEVATVPREGERAGFEIPARYWGAMIACYGLFLAAMLGATGGAYAVFMIVISALYVAIFFGTTRIMLHHAPAQSRSPLDRTGGVLQTIYGPLARREVMAQLLVVPAAIAFFGVAILVVRTMVG